LHRILQLVLNIFCAALLALCLAVQHGNFDSQALHMLNSSCALLALCLAAQQGNFDPQALHMRGVLWMLSSSSVLASLEEPQAGMALTGRLLCIEGE
jgi:hypothetical protein